MTATIVYYSKKGKTAQFARDIAMYLWSKGITIKLCSISDFKEEMLDKTDLLLLGCWTSGWFVINQHPHKKWVEFAKKLPRNISSKLLLFSTYKFHTGSMFRAMKKYVHTENEEFPLILKSKLPLLSDANKRIIDKYIEL